MTNSTASIPIPARTTEEFIAKLTTRRKDLTNRERGYSLDDRHGEKSFLQDAVSIEELIADGVSGHALFDPFVDTLLSQFGVTRGAMSTADTLRVNLWRCSPDQRGLVISVLSLISDCQEELDEGETQEVPAPLAAG